MSATIYRFYIYEKDRFGAPFALCPEHVKTQKIPAGRQLVSVSASFPEQTLARCVKCEEEKHDSRTSEVAE